MNTIFKCMKSLASFIFGVCRTGLGRLNDTSKTDLPQLSNTVQGNNFAITQTGELYYSQLYIPWEVPLGSIGTKTVWRSVYYLNNKDFLILDISSGIRGFTGVRPIDLYKSDLVYFE